MHACAETEAEGDGEEDGEKKECCPGPKPDPGKEVLEMLSADPVNHQKCWQVKPHCPAQAYTTVHACAETEAEGDGEEDGEKKECCPGPKPDPGKEVLEMLSADPVNHQKCWQVKPHCPA